MPSSCGRRYTSRGVSDSIERFTFCSVRMLTICAVTVSSEPTDSAFSSGEPTFTAITTSGRHSSRTSATGRLSTRPPSTSLRPPTSAGASNPGTDMLARMACVSGPLRNTTRSPVPMSVATSATGSDRCSSTGSPRSARTSWLKNSLTFCPATTPGGAARPCGVMPSSLPGRKRCRMCLLRRPRSR